jgi:hypothetical protein
MHVDPPFARLQPLDGATFTGDGTNLAQVRDARSRFSFLLLSCPGFFSRPRFPARLPALHRFLCLVSPGLRCWTWLRQVTAWMKDVDYLFIADNACTYKVRARRRLDPISGFRRDRGA